jgi:hypothetical protein
MPDARPPWGNPTSLKEPLGADPRKCSFICLLFYFPRKESLTDEQRIPISCGSRVMTSMTGLRISAACTNQGTYRSPTQLAIFMFVGIHLPSLRRAEGESSGVSRDSYTGFLPYKSTIIPTTRSQERWSGAVTGMRVLAPYERRKCSNS